MKATFVYVIQMEDSPELEVVGLFKDSVNAIAKSAANDYDDEENGNWRQTRSYTFDVDDDFEKGYVALLIDWIECVESYALAIDKNKEVIKNRLHKEYSLTKDSMESIEQDEYNNDNGDFVLADDSIMENTYGYSIKVTLKEN